MSSANTCLDLVLYEQMQWGERQDVLVNNVDDSKRRNVHDDWKRKKLALARVYDVCSKIEVLDKQLWLLVRNKKTAPTGYQQHLAFSDAIRNMSMRILDMHQRREELIKRYTDIAPSPLFIRDVLESHDMVDATYILKQCLGKDELMEPRSPAFNTVEYVANNKRNLLSVKGGRPTVLVLHLIMKIELRFAAQPPDFEDMRQIYFRALDQLKGIDGPTDTLGDSADVEPEIDVICPPSASDGDELSIIVRAIVYAAPGKPRQFYLYVPTPSSFKFTEYQSQLAASYPAAAGATWEFYSSYNELYKLVPKKMNLEGRGKYLVFRRKGLPGGSCDSLHGWEGKVWLAAKAEAGLTLSASRVNAVASGSGRKRKGDELVGVGEHRFVDCFNLKFEISISVSSSINLAWSIIARGLGPPRLH
ncbi:hypothetical protein B0H11DRAFT_2222217 [Mycena galericulata]|nr:hypothetical protein B0H11DRAFT_2222217 [Mycena galericulata]